MTISEQFPRYTQFDPVVPVWCVTPDEGGCFHRFFDTSPISPSGRYLACLRMPDESRLPRVGESADVVLVDLEAGTQKVVYQTCGWDTQMGANINWGASDNELIFNDVDKSNWKPVTVKLDPQTGKAEKFGRGVYHVSPDGTAALCCSLEKMGRTQWGYGVRIPEEEVPVNWELQDDDGLFHTDLQTGEVKLLHSLKDLIEKYVPERERPAIASHCYYGFHSKWAPSGDRILFTVRAVAAPWALRYDNIGTPLMFYIFTMKPDGSDLNLAMDASFWNRRGHHINFAPDGKSLTLNHVLHFDHMRFVQSTLDGSEKHVMTEAVLGSGHPTLHPDGRHILTDCYQHEPMTAGDGTIPLRWVNIESGDEQHIVRINTGEKSGVPALRIDAHPAWDPTWKWVTFNGAPDGTRRVFVANMSGLL